MPSEQSRFPLDPTEDGADELYGNYCIYSNALHESHEEDIPPVTKEVFFCHIKKMNQDIRDDLLGIIILGFSTVAKEGEISLKAFGE